MKRCCIFSRVSSLHQSAEEQTNELKKEAYKNGYSDDEILVIEWTESAIKLSESERYSIQKLYDSIDTHPIETVICRELSRIARRPDVLYSVRDRLIERGIQLIVCNPYMRLLDEKGKLSQTANIMFSLFSSIAESEMAIKKERFHEGKIRKKNQGKWAGGWLPFGYSYNKETRDIIVVPEEARLILEIFDMYVNKGISTLKIAKHFNQTGELRCCRGENTTVETAVSTIGSMLKNRAYIGEHPIYRSKLVDNVYPAIVSKELFEAASRRLEKHNSRKNASIKSVGKHIYYCSDIIFDKEGNHLTGKSASNSYRFVRHYLKGGNYQITVPINLVDSVVWHFTKEYIKMHNPLTNEEALQKLKEERKTLLNIISTNKKRVAEIENSIIRTNERIVSGKMSERTGDLIIQRFEEEKSSLEEIFLSKMFELKVIEDKIERLSKSKETPLDNEDDAFRSELIHKYIEKVEVLPTTTWGEYELNILYYDMNTDFALIKSMSKRVFNILGNEIQYQYLERFIRNELKK